VKIVFQNTRPTARESTRARKGLALMRFFLLLELFLELRVGLLKITDVVLEQPCFSCSLLLQHVELFVKIDVLSDFFLDASILCLELPEATLDCLQLLRFFLRASGHILYKGED
jgi:hypothetical protein